MSSSPEQLQRRSLTSGSVLRDLLLFSAPVLLTTALQSLDGSVNNFWVSRSLGVSAVTAIGNANVIMMLSIGSITGVTMAVNILIAQRMGANDPQGVKQAMGSAITFFALLAIVIAGCGYFLSGRLLSAMGTPAASVEEAAAYLKVIFLAMPAMYFFNFLQMAQRGIGDSQTPFWFMLIAVAMDVVLNPTLIRGIGFIPAFAIRGSAAATMISQIVSLALLVSYLRYRGSPLMLGWSERGLFRPRPALLSALLTRGLPMGLQMLIMSSTALVMIRFVNGYGASVAAAYTAATQVWTYVQMPAMVLGAAVSSMAAQNVGAGNWKRVGEVARTGVLVSVIATASAALILRAMDAKALALFLPAGSEALGIAMHINTIALWSFLLFAVTFALNGIIRSTGSVWPGLIIVFLSMYLVRIPFAHFLTPRLGADAIWWSFPFGGAVSSSLTALYFFFGPWRTATLVQEASPHGQTGLTGHGAPAVSIVHAAQRV